MTIKIWDLYYEEGLSTGEIARELHIAEAIVVKVLGLD